MLAPGSDYFLLPAWRTRRSILTHEITDEFLCISDYPIFLSRFTCLRVRKCHSSGTMLKCKVEQFLFMLQLLGSIRISSDCSIRDASFSTSSITFRHRSTQLSGRYTKFSESHIESYTMSVIILMQTSVSFINNTAEINGAAIYATTINQCVYTPSIEKINSSTIFEQSIFQLSQQFIFRYINIELFSVLQLTLDIKHCAVVIEC